MLVRHIMIKEPISTNKDVSIKDCIIDMFEKHVGSMIIIDEQQRCVGIFTERDVIRVNAHDIPLDTPIEKVMIKNVYTISEEATFKEAMQIIRDHRIRHLPVTDSEGKIVGLMSIRHVLDDLFEIK